MPYSQQDTGCERGFPVGICGYNAVHERKKSVGVILYFDVDVELDLNILWLHRKFSLLGRGERRPNGEANLHKQSHRFRECRDALLRFLDGPDVLHSIVSIPRPLFNFTCANRADLFVNNTIRTGHNIFRLPLESVVRPRATIHKKTQLNKEGRRATRWAAYLGHGT